MKNWPIKKLGEVLEIQNGFAFDSKSFVIGEGIPLIRIRDLKDGVGTEINFLGKFDNRFLVRSGDLLIGMDGEFACHEWKGTDALLNQRVCRLQNFHQSLSKRFLFYIINDYLSAIEKFTSFTTVKHLSSKQIAEISIPLPPLPEQQRIVKILDEAFEAIENAKENVERNLESSKLLLGSYLKNLFINHGESWEQKKFDEVCVLQRGFDLPTHARNKGIFPLVSSNGITDHIDLWKVPSPGVVTGRSGTIGNVHFIEEDYWPLNTALYIKEFHGNDEKFIYYFLRQFDLSKYSSGAGVPTLNRNNVHGERVWVPKFIFEQRSLVARLDALSAETKKLETIYQRKLACLEELKKSLLQKAFAGDL